jgi:hypothetical protein
MKKRVHAFAGSLALLLVALFWSSTIVSELFLSSYAVVAVKRAILYGIAVLIPALIAAGGSGFALSSGRKGTLAAGKKVRMRLIALNGLLVLAPSALFLYARAAAGQFDPAFFVVQAVELAAGAGQLVLLGRNFRDGLRLSGRLRTRPARTPRMAA